MKCLECLKPAQWIRSTQFAGEHPYCREHAQKESDFKQNDSYTYWYKSKNTDKKQIKSELGYARIGLNR
jgi:hypothetical protein